MRRRNALAIGVLVLAVVSPARGQTRDNAPVAIVNGEAIPRSALDEALRQRPPIVTPLAAAQHRAIHQEIVAALVDEALIRQFLRKNAPPVDATQVNQQLSALEKGLTTQGKSLADYLKETKQTAEQIKATVAIMLQWNAYAATRVTEVDLRKYYADHRDFFDKTTVRASHIVLRVSPHAPPAEREEQRKTLSDLRQEIASGKLPFAEAATKHSQCPSAAKGGDLGFFTRKWMVEEPFAKAAFALKVNELSEVVTTDYGLHLIVPTERKVGQASTFESAKEEVRDCFIEDMKQGIVAELRRTAKVDLKLP